MNWQTPTALIVVVLTALCFLFRLLKKGNDSGKSCGGGCCITKKGTPKFPTAPTHSERR